MASTQSFAELFDAWFSKGEASARESLFHRLRCRVRRALAADAGGWASDVAQDAMLTIASHIKPFGVPRESADFAGTTPAELIAWVLTIARNKARRSGKREGRRDLHRTQNSVGGVVDQGALPGAAAERAEEVERIAAAMKRLSETDRTLLEEYYLKGASYEELAREHDVGPTDPLRQMRVRVHRARRRLERELGRADAPGAGEPPRRGPRQPEETGSESDADAGLEPILQRLAYCHTTRTNDGDGSGEVLGGHARATLERHGFDSGSKLGEGAFASVWSARDRRLGRRVAIKVLHSRRETGRRVDVAELFEEARLLAAATESPHPHLVTLWQILESVPCLVLELVPGCTLTELVHREGPVPAEEAVGYAGSLAAALSHLHDHQVLHRDVKPDNVLYDATTQRVKLTDFGLAQRVPGGQGFVGTPRWMAPEVLSGAARITPAADLYSLAATVVWMLTDSSATGAWAEVLPHSLPGVPEAFEKLVRASLAEAPEDRPSAAEFASATAEWVGPEAGLGALVAQLAVTIEELGDDGRCHQIDKTRRIRNELQVGEALGEPFVCRVRTGSRIVLSITSGSPGFLTVLALGPTGFTVPLHPPQGSREAGRIEADRPLSLPPVRVSPPAGRERVLVLWSRHRPAVDGALWFGLLADGERRVAPGAAQRNLLPEPADPRSAGTDELRAIVLHLDHS